MVTNSLIVNPISSGGPHLPAKHYSNTQSPAVAVRVLIKMKYCNNLQLDIIKYFPHILMYNFVKLRQGSGKDRQGMTLKAKGLFCFFLFLFIFILFFLGF